MATHLDGVKVDSARVLVVFLLCLLLRVDGQPFQLREGRGIRMHYKIFSLPTKIPTTPLVNWSLSGSHLLVVLEGISELGQGGGEHSNEVVAAISIPIIARHLWGSPFN